MYMYVDFGSLTEPPTMAQHKVVVQKSENGESSLCLIPTNTKLPQNINDWQTAFSIFTTVLKWERERLAAELEAARRKGQPEGMEEGSLPGKFPMLGCPLSWLKGVKGMLGVHLIRGLSLSRRTVPIRTPF